METEKHLDLLGLKGKDLVTGFSGVITSISYDLYGCIQVIITPQIDKDGKRDDGRWYDVNRVKITGKKPVMKQPNFDYGRIAEGKKGPALKPIKM